MLDNAWREAAGRPVVIAGGEVWTGARLLDATGRITLPEVRPGEPVAVLVSNRPEDFAAFQAVWRRGGVAMPIHRTSPAAAAESVLRISGARLVLDGEAVEVRDVSPPAPDPVLGGAAVVIFTSGSTGEPKGVVLSRRALESKLANNGRVLGFGPTVRTQLVLQITFSFGLWVSLLTMRAGGVLSVHERFDLPVVLDELASGAIDRTAMVPTMLRATAATGGAGHLAAIRAHGRLRHIYTGGEVLTGGLAAQVTEMFGAATLFNIFGLTETATSDFFLAGDELLTHPGAIGRAGPGVEYRIDAPPGEVGELLIRSATLMTGYLGRPEATAAAFADGFFRTGDLARERDGIVTVVGRVKEVISRGGNKVYPIEIEQVLESHPAVAQALATGVPDPLMGERIHAAVRLVAPVPEPELRAWAAVRLDKFKLPDVLHVVDELPAGRTGKADRARLRQLVGEPHDRSGG